ncbi:hypothetical protein JOQ06_005501 [Pogonophryne albipinna]|uniref:Uncharacterized protein n=1 Tax=Pogonophryne albipinna TaxID=1090488 RepID=A0AAD6BFF0_9TELE|nr:hypothetical protein JOQ06_005501 [Pogonophryne albipinna]
MTAFTNPPPSITFKVAAASFGLLTEILIIKMGGPHRHVPHGACAAWDVPASCCPLSACISVTVPPEGGGPCEARPPHLSPTTRPGRALRRCLTTQLCTVNFYMPCLEVRNSHYAVCVSSFLSSRYRQAAQSSFTVRARGSDQDRRRGGLWEGSEASAGSGQPSSAASPSQVDERKVDMLKSGCLSLY